MAGSEFVEMVVGVGAQRVRTLFKEAKENAPSIVFIDEIDAVGRQRQSSRNEERDNTLNQLLVEMDGFEGTKGVIVLAATNRPDVLDKALTRPGRFDRQIQLPLPDIIGREQIFKVHLKEKKLTKDIGEYAKILSALSPGMSGADISNVCNEAALIASRTDSESINLTHFELAVEKVIGGLERKSRVLDPEEKNIVAHHEAGHAVVGWFMKYSHPLLKVSIVPRGANTLGYAQYLPTEKYITTEDELNDQICLILGGRVAEKLIFNHLSTGAQDDLKKVTQIAYSMIMEYGMSKTVGHFSFPHSQFEKPFSEKLSTIIDSQAKEIINVCYKRTEKLLTEKKDGLLKIAALLLSKEKIDAEDMVEVLGERPESAFSEDNLREFLKSKKLSNEEKKYNK